MQRRFIKALAAVLAGAAIYWILRPHLPVAAQHQIFHEHLGLLIYGLISAAIYGLLYWPARKHITKVTNKLTAALASFPVQFRHSCPASMGMRKIAILHGGSLIVLSSFDLHEVLD